jgi:hypothetical protein
MSALSLAKGGDSSTRARGRVWPENPSEVMVFALGTIDFGIVCALLMSALS